MVFAAQKRGCSANLQVDPVWITWLPWLVFNSSTDKLIICKDLVFWDDYPISPEALILAPSTWAISWGTAVVSNHCSICGSSKFVLEQLFVAAVCLFGLTQLLHRKCQEVWQNETVCTSTRNVKYIQIAFACNLFFTGHFFQSKNFWTFEATIRISIGQSNLSQGKLQTRRGRPSW